MKNKIGNIIFLFLVIINISMLNGCTRLMDAYGIHDETIYPAAYPVSNPAPVKTDGTIYQPGHEISLYEDRIANRVGDILTIKLEETTEGKKKTKTKANKKASNNFTAPQIFGGEARGLAFNTDTDQEFDGEGEANQQNKLTGTISVTVIRVLSNGNMVVQGESWVTINQGREYVRLTGIVRREDIEPNNSISSQRVAQARIAYSGNGQIEDVTRPGILTAILNKFFPY